MSNSELDKFLTAEEKQQLEAWTGKECQDVIFDSYKDNWAMNTSTFDDKVKFRKELIFVIEDANNNKFGAYMSEQMKQNFEEPKMCGPIGPDGKELPVPKLDICKVRDANSFLFSLKSNGRLNGMHKFEIKSEYCACSLRVKSDKWLIGFGNWDIWIAKENVKSESGCHQFDYCYNYHGMTNVFVPNCTNKVYYTPKRFMVIQMK